MRPAENAIRSRKSRRLQRREQRRSAPGLYRAKTRRTLSELVFLRPIGRPPVLADQAQDGCLRLIRAVKSISRPRAAEYWIQGLACTMSSRHDAVRVGWQRKVHALIFTAVYSRHMFVWLSLGQTRAA
jgi:hypothetical protein